MKFIENITNCVVYMDDTCKYALTTKSFHDYCICDFVSYNNTITCHKYIDVFGNPLFILLCVFGYMCILFIVPYFIMHYFIQIIIKYIEPNNSGKLKKNSIVLNLHFNFFCFFFGLFNQIFIVINQLLNIRS